MKKTILTLLVCITTLTISAQSDDTPYKEIETSRDIQLSSEQIAKIKKIKRDAGAQFQAIGRDRSLSGQEKGSRKRELAAQLRKDINNVLTDSQRAAWETKHGNLNSNETILDAISDDYDRKLDALEKRYDRDKDAIDDNDRLNKSEKKAQKSALKKTYKAEKESLKSQKEEAKRNIRL